ncbi:MAG: protein phosphatase 2C domain-containing protein [candidate division WWE3 bacterium]|nr:protein phosphatase 2C domain-containing protein [candidate division WWE3 bacterium]
MPFWERQADSASAEKPQTDEGRRFGVESGSCAYAYQKKQEQDEHPSNQDRYFTAGRAFGVFDGVGSLAESGTAAEMARDAIINKFQQYPRKLNVSEAQNLAQQSLETAQAAVMTLRGAGETTAAIGVIAYKENGERALIVAHAGDSRVYLRRQIQGKWQIYCLTVDDSEASKNMNQADAVRLQNKLDEVVDIEEAAKRGQVTPQEYTAYKQRHVMSNSVGPHAKGLNISGAWDIFTGDEIIIATDGVHDNLTNSEINKTLTEGKNSQEQAIALNNAAYLRSQDTRHPRHKADDITSVVTKVVAEDLQPVTPEAPTAPTDIKAGGQIKGWTVIARNGDFAILNKPELDEVGKEYTRTRTVYLPNYLQGLEQTD